MFLVLGVHKVHNSTNAPIIGYAEESHQKNLLNKDSPQLVMHSTLSHPYKQPPPGKPFGAFFPATPFALIHPDPEGLLAHNAAAHCHVEAASAQGCLQRERDSATEAVCVCVGAGIVMVHFTLLPSFCSLFWWSYYVILFWNILCLPRLRWWCSLWCCVGSVLPPILRGLFRKFEQPAARRVGSADRPPKESPSDRTSVLHGSLRHLENQTKNIKPKNTIKAKKPSMEQFAWSVRKYGKVGQHQSDKESGWLTS